MSFESRFGQEPQKLMNEFLTAAFKPGDITSWSDVAKCFKDHAELLIPGSAQTLSKSRLYGHHSPTFPDHAVCGQGALIGASNGEIYLDFICGLGAMSLGYGVVEGAEHVGSLCHGSFSVSSFLEVLAAKDLVELIPCAEQIRFVKTGSEACQAAVRIARSVTGRSRIVVVGYHGWHDWFAASRDESESPGIPQEYRTVVQRVEYNNERAMADALKAGDVAAVMLEPVRENPPHDGYLHRVVNLARDVETLVIFDEMLCGFRWRIAGGQEFFDVSPDLAVFGKAMANGAPLACVVGGSDLMAHAWTCSGTFSGETYSLGKCLQTVDIYKQRNVVGHMWDTGRELQDRMNFLVRQFDRQVLFRVEGYPVHPVFRGDPVFIQKVIDGLAQRHILMHPKGVNIMLVHGEDDLRAVEEVLSEVLGEIVSS